MRTTAATRTRVAPLARRGRVRQCTRAAQPASLHARGAPHARLRAASPPPKHAARAQLTRPQLGASLNGTPVYALLRPAWHGEDHRLALRLTAIGLRDAVRPYRFRHANTSAGETAARQSLFYLRAADHVMFWYDAWERRCPRLLALEQVIASDRPKLVFKCPRGRAAVCHPDCQNSPTCP